MNRLVPYLDLYGRLSDEELGRLALGIAAPVVANLRGARWSRWTERWPGSPISCPA